MTKFFAILTVFVFILLIVCIFRRPAKKNIFVGSNSLYDITTANSSGPWGEDSSCIRLGPAYNPGETGDHIHTIITQPDGTKVAIEGRIGIGLDRLPSNSTGSRNVIIGTKNIPQPFCKHLTPIKYTGIHQYCGEKLHPDSILFCSEHYRANKHH